MELGGAVMRADFGEGMMLLRRFDKATEQSKRALDLNPRFFNAADILMWAQIGKGDHNAAATSFEVYLGIINQPEEIVTTFRRTFDASGLRAGLVGWLDSQKSAEDLPGIGPGSLAAIYAWCNEEDRAFEWLDNAIEWQDPFIVVVATHFAFDNLRDDPRYADLLTRIRVKTKSEEVQSKP